ncbi:hypothetical protein LTR62_008050 [Meristemomyces frigidus]|uniref:Uncharacterized protein n=1 Tax=Meristemomyces frigidus TaxID=1508187 RepID=A0AAN7YIS9_9PEZI|nr:hypothetical protein LTR62_008050 [Meristemomyces frigidus]
MATLLRLPTFALATLSIILNIAVLACAARTLHFYDSEQKTNVWLLPVWPNHFDTRELHALVGTSAAIVALNVVLGASLFVQKLPANTLVLATSFFSAICSLVAIVFPIIINSHAPRRDTLQTWTCRWSAASSARDEAAPGGFEHVCRETRFAFYTTIPIFILQLLLLTIAVYALVSGSPHSHTHKPSKTMGDTEKNPSQHELGEVSHNQRGQSFDTKHSGSPLSRQEEVMGAKGVSFA